LRVGAVAAALGSIIALATWVTHLFPGGHAPGARIELSALHVRAGSWGTFQQVEKQVPRDRIPPADFRRRGLIATYFATFKGFRKGDKIPIHLDVFPLRGATGTPVGYFYGVERIDRSPDECDPCPHWIELAVGYRVRIDLRLWYPGGLARHEDPKVLMTTYP
jgi:hypothetical protein